MRGEFKVVEWKVLSVDESRECESEGRRMASGSRAAGRSVLSQLVSSSSSSSSLETDRGENLSGSCKWSGSGCDGGTVGSHERLSAIFVSFIENVSEG